MVWNFRYVLLFLAFKLFYTQSEDFKRFHIFLGSFDVSEITNTRCHDDATKDTGSVCGLKAELFTNSINAKLYQLDRPSFHYEINKEYFFTRTNDIVTCMNITIETWETTWNFGIIDEWRIECLNLQPGETHNVISEFGMRRKARATFFIWFECPEYAGFNCQKQCSKTRRTYCDINGDKQCKPEFYNHPECLPYQLCSRTKPCLNNATCEDIPINNYKCQCTKFYKGRNCTILRCDPTVCAGTCLNGICVCTRDQVDSTCESYCNPPCVHGKCIELRGKYVCQCEFNHEGLTCEVKSSTIGSINNSTILGYAGIIVGALVGFALFGTVCYFISNRYKKRSKYFVKN